MKLPNILSNYGNPEIKNKDCQNILNSLGQTMFSDDEFIRKLSREEVVNAIQELNIDFKQINLIPLFDCADNDFICFDFKHNYWVKFNIVDEVVFNKNLNIVNYIKK